MRRPAPVSPIDVPAEAFRHSRDCASSRCPTARASHRRPTPRRCRPWWKTSAMSACTRASKSPPNRSRPRPTCRGTAPPCRPGSSRTKSIVASTLQRPAATSSARRVARGSCPTHPASRLLGGAELDQILRHDAGPAGEPGMDAAAPEPRSRTLPGRKGAARLPWTGCGKRRRVGAVKRRLRSRAGRAGAARHTPAWRLSAAGVVVLAAASLAQSSISCREFSYPTWCRRRHSTPR